MTRRILIVLVGVGLAMLGNSAAWSEDADQAALIKAISGAKITLLQGIAQVAKGTEVPTEAKYEMEDGKLMLSVYTSAKGFDTAAEDNSFNEYGGDATAAAWTQRSVHRSQAYRPVGAVPYAAVNDQSGHSGNHPEGLGAEQSLVR
jgi:hypothetical protein